ncbi:unnamed protein product [Owenia fusiformis]|uniref:LITAF domain-containing protein n=1 Tax=Owenia fusiformis TaxID=6347 RepID=A0A8S4P6F0_OWEFU|nr:unnamed protein product [Owenia fusiformis]
MTDAAPPTYGSVAQQNPAATPATNPTFTTESNQMQPGGGSTYPPAVQPPAPVQAPGAQAAGGAPYATPYPQPGQQMPGKEYPQEPPPKYEAPGGAGAPGYPPQGAYPPQGSYPQGSYPQGYQQQTVMAQPVQQTVIVQSSQLGPHPKMMECPHCHATVTTTVTYQSGGLTWLSAGLLCLFGCWMGCCLIPFCIDDLQDADHGFCDRHFLNTPRRMGLLLVFHPAVHQ